jgi:hypothetical protein
MKTAEEFFGFINGEIAYPPDFVHRTAIEFAKLHCEAQLKAILENACMKEYNQGDWDTCWISNDMEDAYVLDKNSIINAYNLNQIK